MFRLLSAAPRVCGRFPKQHPPLVSPRPPLLPPRLRPPPPPPLQHQLRAFLRSPTRRSDHLPDRPPSSSPPSKDQPRLLDRLRASGQLSDLHSPPPLTPFQRLIRPFLFTLLSTSFALYYGYTWTPPTQSTRLLPTVPQSFATVSSLIALNSVVFLAWRIPVPVVWRTLNRYFISVSALPHAPSILGNTFSHQSFSHFAMNMVVLYVFGTSLCEQLGSGWFLATYISAGAVSSFSSLAWSVARRQFTTTSLGASGAIAGLIGAFAVLNPDSQVYLVFLPFLVLRAKVFVGLLAAIEALGIVRGWRVFDHMAHLSGIIWGSAVAEWLRREAKRRRERVSRIWGR